MLVVGLGSGEVPERNNTPGLPFEDLSAWWERQRSKPRVGKFVFQLKMGPQERLKINGLLSEGIKDQKFTEHR